MQNAALAPQPERRHRGDERRRQSQGGQVVPPSPALVRHGSKQRKIPAALTPGGNTPGAVTPHSAAAQVNVPVGRHHPYAAGGYDYGEENYNQQQYGRASPMVSSVGAAPPAVSNVRARGGDVGVSQSNGEYQQETDDAPPKNTLLRILTCRCG
jgi:casein kinase 1